MKKIEYIAKYKTTSRYGTSRFLNKISDNLYILTGESHFIRGSEDFIDFEGGPYISVGMNLMDIFGVDEEVTEINLQTCIIKTKNNDNN